MNEQIHYYENKLKFEINSENLYQALSQKQNVVPIDTRPQDAYGARHLPGALNIPHGEMNSQTTKDLDKNSLYVTYCDGMGSNDATRGALNMANLGFQVKELIGGIDRWVQGGYATENKR